MSLVGSTPIRSRHIFNYFSNNAEAHQCITESLRIKEHSKTIHWIPAGIVNGEMYTGSVNLQDSSNSISHSWYEMAC